MLTWSAFGLQVRTAYRAMAAIYHPDRNAASDASAKYMQVRGRQGSERKSQAW